MNPREVQELFDVIRGLDSFDWTPKYNVAPTTIVPCVRETDGGRELFPARWGLIPSWCKDKPPAATFNARSDTVSEKPMFRSAFKSRRCLVLASGFYEWHQVNPKTKQPHMISLKSGEPMAMAGLWETWANPAGETIESCTICTTDANPFMFRLHDRMPVILPDAMIDPWLDPAIKDASKLQPILAQFPSGEMQEWPVSRDVGNVKHQGEYLMEPLEDDVE